MCCPSSSYAFLGCCSSLHQGTKDFCTCTAQVTRKERPHMYLCCFHTLQMAAGRGLHPWCVTNEKWPHHPPPFCMTHESLLHPCPRKLLLASVAGSVVALLLLGGAFKAQAAHSSPVISSTCLGPSIPSTCGECIAQVTPHSLPGHNPCMQKQMWGSSTE
jgi:hypothetical protein